jgi:uncharacterized membrane protein YfcA
MENKKLKMDTQTIIILLMIGLVAGMLGGVVGVGGGIVIVPALVYFLGFNQHTAQGTSLGLIMLPVGILGFLQYYYSCQKAGTPINFNVIGILAIAFVVGSFFGSKIALSVSQDILKKCFAILLVVVAIKMLFFDNQKTSDQNSTTSSIKNISG